VSLAAVAPCADNHENSMKEGKWKEGTYSGSVTTHAIRRMKKACDLLSLLAVERLIYRPDFKEPLKFRINFITLTLPSAQGNFSDKDIHTKIFLPWLRYCQRRFGLNLYIWRAERQKNGNIHYHLLTNTWIDKHELTKTWNYHCDKLKLWREYKRKHGEKQAPSTNVKNASNEKEVAEYIRKYVRKKSNAKDKVNIKVWDCAKILKTCPYHCTDIDSQLYDKLNLYHYILPASFKLSDYYAIIERSMMMDDIMEVPSVRQSYDSWLHDSRALARVYNDIKLHQ
jgi:hypothetical protein